MQDHVIKQNNQIVKSYIQMCNLQGRLNLLKVVGAQLTNKTHFYYKKLNSYEHLQILWGHLPPVLPWFHRL